MKKINDFIKYSENPSKVLKEDIKEVSITKKGEVFEMSNSDGEVRAFHSLDKIKRGVVDNRKYIKLFIEDIDLVKDLSTSGLKVFCYIMKNIGIKKDNLVIVLEDCMEYTGYTSRVNVYNGIANLLEKGIIYRKEGSSSYFINVNVFYNGNRRKATKEDIQD